jgi:hypothetical protein
LAASSVPTRRQLYIPLTIAAAIVYRAFPEARREPPGNEQELEKRMDESARTVSIAIRVYRLDLADPVQIDSSTLSEGVFAGGGCLLLFDDGRPPIEPLGVIRADLDAALAKRAHIVPENRPEAIIPSKFIRPKLFR